MSSDVFIFRYNCVALGFTLWAVVHFLRENFAIGSVLFLCSLLFKQMSLYYAPTMFFFLLGRVLLGRRGDDGAAMQERDEPLSPRKAEKKPFASRLLHFLGLTALAILTTAVILLPFLSPPLLRQVRNQGGRIGNGTHPPLRSITFWNPCLVSLWCHPSFLPSYSW